MGRKISINNAIKIAEQKGGLEDLKNVSFTLNNSYLKKINEIRSVTIQTKLKPSEKDKFLSLIGRETESNIVRNLILEFIKNNS